MKKRVSALLMAVIMVLTITPTVFAKDGEQTAPLSSEWGSNYDSTDEFHITCEDDLWAFAAIVNADDAAKDFQDKKVVLDSDITITRTDRWVPIGAVNMLTDDYDDDLTNPDATNSFAGVFDGQGKTISGLTCYSGSDEDNILYDASGLFGFVSGTISDVNLVNASIKAAGYNIGGIAGILLDGGQISGCTVSGTISGDTYDEMLYGEHVGGIVGEARGETSIRECTNNASVSGITSVGGIVGSVNGDKLSISASENYGKIVGNSDVGGIVGGGDNFETNALDISKCLNSGDVSG